MKAVEICKKINHKKGLASNYNNIAVIYKERAKYADALRYYLNSLEIREKSGDKYGLVVTFNGLQRFTGSRIIQSKPLNTIKRL